MSGDEMAGWKEAVIAWSVCASIHRKFGKGRDALYTTRQADFVKHEAVARAALDAASAIPDLSVVRLTEAVEGIEAGSYGTVVHVYQGSALAESGYAVEFSNPSRVVVVARSQIEPEVWTEEDLRAADAKAEELHRYFHPEEYERAMAALRPFAAVGQFLFARDLPDDTPVVDLHGINGRRGALTRGDFKAAHEALAAWEAIYERNLRAERQSAASAERAALLAKLQDDPAVRQAVIDALMTTTGWVSSFPGELRLAATALTDAAIAKIEEMLK